MNFSNALPLSALSRVDENIHDLLVIFRSSCQAFDRYETLRHMSDEQLKELGLDRDEVCDALFAELYGHSKTGASQSGPRTD
jgi:hypothetical protein